MSDTSRYIACKKNRQEQFDEDKIKLLFVCNCLPPHWNTPNDKIFLAKYKELFLWVDFIFSTIFFKFEKLPPESRNPQLTIPNKHFFRI